MLGCEPADTEHSSSPRVTGPLVWRYYSVDEHGVSLLDESGAEVAVVAEEPWQGLSLTPVGTAENRFPIGLGDRIGFVTRDGEVAINPQFDLAGLFSGGRTVVMINRKMGIVDGFGRFLLPPDFDGVGRPVNDRVPVQFGDRWAILDFGRRYIVQPQYEMVRPYAEGRAAVRQDGRWGFVDARGNPSIRPQFDEVTEFDGGVALVRLGDQCGLIDSLGTYVMPPRRACRFEPATEGRFTIVSNGRYGYVDLTGRVVIVPQFDDARGFHEGLAAVRIGTRWGYVDTTGRFAVPLRYLEAGDFSRGRAVIRNGDRYGLIDRSGGTSSPSEWDGAAKRFEGPLLLVRRGDSLGYVNERGRPVHRFMRPAASLRGWRQLRAMEERLPANDLYHDALVAGITARLPSLPGPGSWTELLEDIEVLPSRELLPTFIRTVQERAQQWAIPVDQMARQRLEDRLSTLPLEYQNLWNASQEAAMRRATERIARDAGGLPTGSMAAGILGVDAAVEAPLTMGAPAFWLLDVGQRQQLTMHLSSSDFDPVLELLEGRDNQWRLVASDDDGGGGSSSQLTWAPQAGTAYAARARAYNTAESGMFRLTLAEAGRPLEAEVRAAASSSMRPESAYFDFQVDQPVAPIPGPGAPRYPDVLRSAGIEGEVLAQFVVDTLGHIEVSSFRAIRTSNDLFEAAVRAALPSMRFVPAEVGGRKVRQFVQQPFVFALAR